MRPTRLPAGMRKSHPSTAWMPPKCLTRPLTMRMSSDRGVALHTDALLCPTRTRLRGDPLGHGRAGIHGPALPQEPGGAEPQDRDDEQPREDVANGGTDVGVAAHDRHEPGHLGG